MRMHRRPRRPVNLLRAKTIPATHLFVEKRVAAMDLRKCVSAILMQLRHVSVAPLRVLDGSLKLSAERSFKAPAKFFGDPERIARQVEARAPIPSMFGHDPTNFACFGGQ